MQAQQEEAQEFTTETILHPEEEEEEEDTEGCYELISRQTTELDWSEEQCRLQCFPETDPPSSLQVRRGRKPRERGGKLTLLRRLTMLGEAIGGISANPLTLISWRRITKIRAAGAAAVVPW